MFKLTPCSNVSIGNFEQLIVDWGATAKKRDL